MSACSVVGERQQGTLEPILITPFHPEEFLVGKALAARPPTVLVAYTIFGIFLTVTGLLAHPGISSAVFEGSHIPVWPAFTPRR